MINNVARRHRERREARLRILDAARDIFMAGGEEGLTLRRVAERIEYSATTIYLHFRNKDELVGELCATDFAVFSRKLVQADRLTDPVDRLKKTAAGYADFGLQFPGQYRVMFITGRSSEQPADSRSDRRTKQASTSPSGGDQIPGKTDENPKGDPGPHDFLQSAVFKALAAGIFKPEYRDAPLITQTIWGGLHGVISLYQTRAKHPSVAWRPIQSLTEMMIECLLNGMMIPSSVATPAWRRAE